MLKINILKMSDSIFLVLTLLLAVWVLVGGVVGRACAEDQYVAAVGTLYIGEEVVGGVFAELKDVC